MKTGSKERFMNLCRHHRILLWDIYESEQIFHFSIASGDFKKLIPLAKKAGVVPHIENKNGAPVCGKKLRRNLTLVIALIFFLGALYGLSGYVWTIEISGQQEYTKERLLKTLLEIDVRPGMKRKDLNCDKIETYLRKSYDNLSWISAEEVGSRLQIKVKEGKKTISVQEEEQAVHLIANVDGVVESAVTQSGTPIVRKGDVVKKGDVLISGLVDVKNDSKEVISQIPVAASGSVIIKANLSYENKLKKNYNKKVFQDERICIYRFWFGDKNILLKNPIKSFDKSFKYDIINKVCMEEPVRIIQSTYFPYYFEKASYTKQEAENICRKAFREYVAGLLEEGCKVESESVDFVQKGSGYELKGMVTCRVPQRSTAVISAEEWSVNNQDAENREDS